MIVQRLIFLLAAFMLSLPSMGENIVVPFAFENAQVLPKGIRNVRVRGFTTQAFDQYNSTGSNEPIGQALNRSVTWQDIANGQPSAQESGSTVGLLNSLGINLNDSAGDTTGVVNARATVTAPILAYGITKGWTSAIAIPVVYRNINVDTGFVANGALNNFVGNQLDAENLRIQAEKAAARFLNLVNTKAVEAGYDPIGPSEQTDIGDIKLVQKVMLYNNSRFALVLNQETTLPTGKQADFNKVVDIGSGDGQWDFGVGSTFDFKFNRFFNITGNALYTVQLSDNVPRHIPRSENETITPEVDNNVYRDLGDIFSSNLAAHLTLFETWRFSTALGYHRKQEDEYTGGLFQQARYDILALDSAQTMQTGQLGIQFSTIPLFKRKRFPVPIQASLGYTAVLSGTNVTSDPVTSFELAVFF